MIILTLIFSLVFLGSSPGYVQNSSSIDTLSASMIDENGVLVVSSLESWKYHPGDNPAWANPSFDDSDWYDIKPHYLPIDEMPDSLWDGYGWWRKYFTADSSFHAENWNLYFNSWGAAEVYLNGKIIHEFGEFSVNSNEGKNYIPFYKYPQPLQFQESDIYTLAVRYSHHEAKKFGYLRKQLLGSLGFSLGFSSYGFNEYVSNLRGLQSFTLFFSSAVLLVLLLLHFTLYLKFREDRSNLLISMLIGLELVSVIAYLFHVMTDLNSFWYTLLYNTFVYVVTASFLLIPYIVSSIFRIKKFYETILLVVALLLLGVTDYFLPDFFDPLSLILFTISFFFTGLIIWKAYKINRRGVKFVAGGALGSIFTLIYSLIATEHFSVSAFHFYISLTLTYTLFPFGLTLFVADRYGYLYNSMEEEVKKRTAQLREAYADLEESLKQLTATQDQLVQQEKLASLGQLTAGIAHEIKNPLNFVNNFSDLSLELIEEARDEIKAAIKSPFEGGKDGEAGQGDDPASKSKIDSSTSNTPLNPLSRGEDILTILNDIETNLRKIHEHGSRADGIVKSMLQHSRGGDGKMEPTDLNGLVKEYVNLAFHGMRAGKDPINVDIEMDLDENIGDVPLIAEDFSRVILNLCNNAFDAMREKALSPTPLPGGEGRRGEGEYQPKLSVQTHRNDQTVTIEIQDNGPGIPNDIKDKILQPFFTTKKGTQGTGLGLSITHDIVKAHGGEITIESELNSFTRFQIKLNTNQ